MDRLGKYVKICLVVMFALFTLIIAIPTNAETIPKPASPNFTIETIDSSYDVPATTSSTTNPYTGQVTTTTTPSYHVENKTTYIKITNQPFIPYQINQNGQNWSVNRFYNIQVKGHYATEWGNYKYNNGSSDRNLIQDYSSQFTIVPINDYLPKEGEVDFRVQALEGYQHGIDIYPGVPGEQWIITGSASDWSSVQTFNVVTGLVSISPTAPVSSPSQAIPEFPIVASLITILSVASLLLIIGKKSKVSIIRPNIS